MAHQSVTSETEVTPTHHHLSTQTFVLLHPVVAECHCRSSGSVLKSNTQHSFYQLQVLDCCSLLEGLLVKNHPLPFHRREQRIPGQEKQADSVIMPK